MTWQDSPARRLAYAWQYEKGNDASHIEPGVMQEAIHFEAYHGPEETLAEVKRVWQRIISLREEYGDSIE